MTDHITEKKVESEGKVFNKNRGKTVSKSRTFPTGSELQDLQVFIDLNVPSVDWETTERITITVTKHLD